jgi:hypothetical protein
MKQMKTELKNHGMVTTAMGLLGLLAGAGAVLGVITYLHANEHLDSAEQKAVLNEKLAEASQYNIMIRQLNDSQPDVTRQMLNSRLAYDLAQIDSLASAVDSNSQAFARSVVTAIAREERAHPEYYLASVKRVGFENAAVMQMVRH